MMSPVFLLDTILCVFLSAAALLLFGEGRRLRRAGRHQQAADAFEQCLALLVVLLLLVLIGPLTLYRM